MTTRMLQPWEPGQKEGAPKRQAQLRALPMTTTAVPRKMARLACLRRPPSVKNWTLLVKVRPLVKPRQRQQRRLKQRPLKPVPTETAVVEC
jgi:hypothetical protein